MEQQRALEPIGFHEKVPPPARFAGGQRLSQYAQSLVDLPRVACGLGQQDQTERLRQRLPRQQVPNPTKAGNPCVVASVSRASACACTARASRR